MRRARTAARLLIGLFGAAALACSSSDGPTDAGATGQDAAPTDAPEDDAGTVADAGAPDAGADDGNDDFSEAVEAVKNGGFGTPGAIGWPGDRDYFFFDGAAGEFVSVFTTSTPSRLGNQVDTVIRLYDASMAQVAENDDAVPRVDVNSEIIYRLPAAGRYFVEVLEWSDWAMEPPVGGEDYRYRVSVVTVATNDAGVTVEAEAGDDAASAIETSFSPGAGILCGAFERASDVDVFRFAATGERTNLYASVMPTGPAGYGSTSALGHVRVTDLAGTQTVARFDFTGEVVDFSPSLPLGEFLLWLEPANDAAGPNDFYVLKLFSLTENPAENEPNDEIGAADHRTLLPREQQMDRAAFLLTHLPDGDVDYFEFDVAANETVSVVCGAQSEGSGVRELEVTLVTLDGTELARATETPDAVAELEAAPGVAGPVYLRLRKGSQDPMVAGDYARCGIFATIE